MTKIHLHVIARCDDEKTLCGHPTCEVPTSELVDWPKPEWFNERRFVPCPECMDEVDRTTH